MDGFEGYSEVVDSSFSFLQHYLLYNIDLINSPEHPSFFLVMVVFYLLLAL